MAAGNMRLWRQQGILSGQQIGNEVITGIGAGGIGSWVYLELAKMGFTNFRFFDPDVVENHNIATQAYREADEGLPKVEALKDILMAFAGITNVSVTQAHFTGQERLSGIVICAVDSMDTRINIWRTSVRYKPSIKLYIEARMGAEELRVYSLNPTDPDHVSQYEQYLYPSSDAFQAPCTERSIGYTVFASAAIIGREVKAFLTGEDVAFENILGLKSRIWVVQ